MLINWEKEGWSVEVLAWSDGRRITKRLPTTHTILEGVFTEGEFIPHQIQYDDIQTGKLVRYHGTFQIFPDETDVRNRYKLDHNKSYRIVSIQFSDQVTRHGTKKELSSRGKALLEEIGCFSENELLQGQGERKYFLNKQLRMQQIGHFSEGFFQSGELQNFHQNDNNGSHILIINKGTFDTNQEGDEVLDTQDGSETSAERYRCDSTFSKETRTLIEQQKGLFKGGRFVSGRQYKIILNGTTSHYWFGRMHDKAQCYDDPDGVLIEKLSDDTLYVYCGIEKDKLPKYRYNVVLSDQNKSIEKVFFVAVPLASTHHARDGVSTKARPLWLLQKKENGHWVKSILEKQGWREDQNSISIEARKILTLLEARLVEVGWAQSQSAQTPQVDKATTCPSPAHLTIAELTFIAAQKAAWANLTSMHQRLFAESQSRVIKQKNETLQNRNAFTVTMLTNHSQIQQNLWQHFSRENTLIRLYSYLEKRVISLFSEITLEMNAFFNDTQSLLPLLLKESHARDALQHNTFRIITKLLEEPAKRRALVDEERDDFKRLDIQYKTENAYEAEAERYYNTIESIRPLPIKNWAALEVESPVSPLGHSF